MNSRFRYLTLGFLLSAILGLAFTSWLYETHPGARRSLVHEGGFVQNATADLFFASFLLGIWSISRVEPPRRSRFAPIPAAAAFGWLEETSYGERLFHLHPPLLFHKHIDSLHSLIGALLLPFKRSAHVNLLQSVFWAALVVLAIRHRALQRLANFARRHPAWRFLLLASGLVLLAQLIDMRVLRWRDSHVMEEVLELYGAVATLIASACIGFRHTAEAPAPGDRATLAPERGAPLRDPLGPTPPSG